MRLGKNNGFILIIKLVTFEVLTAVILKISAFWDVTPCNLVDVY
jgi:hypothetical protein